jgi:hypothetical protein
MLADAAAADPRGRSFWGLAAHTPLSRFVPRRDLLLSAKHLSVHCRTGHLNRGVDGVF